MRQARRPGWALAALVAAVLLLGGMWGFAVEYETIQAVAQGQSTQLGQRHNFTLIVYEFSTADDQKALVEAFKAAGQQGLFNTVHKMKAKGHMALTGTLGYDVNYIKELNSRMEAAKSVGHPPAAPVRRNVVGYPLHGLQPLRRRDHPGSRKRQKFRRPDAGAGAEVR